MSVVEVTTFRLRLPEGADEASFLALDKRVQTELVPNRPGFIRRTTAHRGADWVVVTLWASEAEASAFADAVTADPVWTEFVRCHEPGSQSTQRFDTLD